jgi:hypothetical protein
VKTKISGGWLESGVEKHRWSRKATQQQHMRMGTGHNSGSKGQAHASAPLCAILCVDHSFHKWGDGDRRVAELSLSQFAKKTSLRALSTSGKEREKMDRF